ESEIVGEMERLADHFRLRVLENYVNSELGMGLTFDVEGTPEAMLAQIRETLASYDARQLERVSRIVAAPPVGSPVGRELAAGDGNGTALLTDGSEAESDEATEEAETETSDAGSALEVFVPEGTLVPADYSLDEIISRIQVNTWARAGFDPHS